MTNPLQFHVDYQEDILRSKSDLTRFLVEDGSNYFDANKIWTDKSPIVSGDVNVLLDNGAFGLEWLRLALVRYHRAGDVLGDAEFKKIDIPPLQVGGEPWQRSADVVLPANPPEHGPCPEPTVSENMPKSTRTVTFASNGAADDEWGGVVLPRRAGGR